MEQPKIEATLDRMRELNLQANPSYPHGTINHCGDRLKDLPDFMDFMESVGDDLPRILQRSFELAPRKGNNPVKNDQHFYVVIQAILTGGDTCSFNESIASAACLWLGSLDMISAYHIPIEATLATLHRFHFSEGKQLSEDCLELLKATLTLSSLGTSKKDLSEARRYLRKLIHGPGALPLAAGDQWADLLIKRVHVMPEKKRERWKSLLAHCAQANSAKPSANWSADAKPILSKFRRPELEKELGRIFHEAELPSLIDRDITYEYDHGHNYLDAFHPLSMEDENMDVLRGLVWVCSLRPSEKLTRAVQRLTISAYRKIPGIGQRAVRVGNACLYSLRAIPGEAALAALAYLKIRIKFKTAQNLITKAFEAKAEAMGIPAFEVEEMAVPAYGLSEVGQATIAFGEKFTAHLKIEPSDKVTLVWENKETGKIQKSIPATVKNDHADDLKDTKAMVQDITKMLPAQRQRIEQLYCSKRTWSVEKWRERYLDHPLVGSVARRLIWTFTNGDEVTQAMWKDEVLVTRDGLAFDPDAKAKVSLWHPLESSSDAVLAWREFFEDHLIRQPFKQAHREVYVLTPAEEETKTYSNRFASHYLKQHQFNALCGARNWRNVLRLMVDDEYPPASLVLDEYDLRVDYRIEGAGNDYNDDTVTGSGAFRYLSTDQVRFYPRSAPISYAHASGGGYHWEREDGEVCDPVSLREIPARIFSEVMRDIDLFVGVASVGNDPNWLDSGPENRYRDYWQTYSFGDLSGSAVSRKELLQNLVPKLKIASQCSFEDKFLVVTGSRHRYKIHLGSGNILIASTNTYLCIVPSAGAVNKTSNKVFLPFEGDGKLSLILSKAFLLAEDEKIKDPTILAQL